MAAYLTPNPKMQFFDDNGDPLSGGKLYTYAAGTTTPQATYTDSTGGVENSNPVILDSRGEASIWTGKARYYWALHDSDDSLVWTADNVGGGVDSDIWLTSVAGTNTITGNAVPAPAQYVLGMTFKFIAVADNTGAMTLNVSGLGAVALTKNGTSAMVAGDITAGMLVTVVYDGTRVQLTNGVATVSYDSPELTGTPTTPTAAAGTSTTQIASTAFVSTVPVEGQCELVKSGSNLVLLPKNGNRILINGVQYLIPSAGVSLAPTSLTPGTNYYIYAYMSGATMTLEASATTHATDTTYGNEIKNGDATRSLVGLARCVTGPAWSDTDAARLVRSWFNDKGIFGAATITSDKTVSATSYTLVSSTLMVEFLAWDGERLSAQGNGVVQATGDNQNVYSTLYLDGAAPTYGCWDTHNRGGTSAGQYAGHSPHFVQSVGEGYHYVEVYGKVTGGSGVWIGAASAPSRYAVYAELS